VRVLPSSAQEEEEAARGHGGFCSLRHTFCLAEPGCKAAERLEHGDTPRPRVVEAALAALSTLVENAMEGRAAAAEGGGRPATTRKQNVFVG
jgi:hypothetical protein